ncbi:RDD family protein [Paenibacillus physcomitrellae]|uniref:RDD domain-containing protein n=1 Tax=Paenibacillus physcomitrellae TaxID=1619311 RepID=A0ABQ1GJE8_9BACL|nr:RDD family protein [Paenibacillus physcomitrellae]GGA45057.1 hypothetical protein GCM10010917_32920 [Paenibacillus physcomitrellae]
MKEPAGFWIRFAAFLSDGIIVWIASVLLTLIVYGTLFNTPRELTNMLSLLYTLLLPVFWAGFTLGKRMLGIRITKMDGSHPGLLAMVLRVIVGGLVYGLTFGVGVIVSAIMIGVREDKRAIHDFIAGTQVVYD